MNNLELAFKYEDENEPAKAEEIYLQMLALEPHNPLALFNYGRICWKWGVIDKAAKVFKRLTDTTEDAEFRTAYANLLLDRGNTPEAVEQFRLAKKPSDMLFAATHLGNADQLHSEWFNGLKPQVFKQPQGNNIGWVSGNFRNHTVPKFLDAVIDQSDYLYSDTTATDATTERYKAFKNYRDISAMTDEQLAEQLQKDGTGTVIDLSGHLSSGKRALFFAGLPKSYSYIGYPCTTGIPQQIRITDKIIDPADTGEKIIRLHQAYGYAGDHSVEVMETKHERGECKVFGSLNRPAKYSDSLLNSWAKIIQQSGGKLRLLVPHGNQQMDLRERVIAAGVPSDSLELVASGGDYWGFIRSCDLILDAFNYSGMTTAADALWAGVPFITLEGDTPQSRVGASLLHSVGIPHWIAQTEAEYVRLAADSRHWLRGEALRARLQSASGRTKEMFRNAVKASPLQSSPMVTATAVAGSEPKKKKGKGCGCSRNEEKSV
jgi:predicted O-linked N-acetylglucosamine transferase (SPINDLY family)